MPEVAKTHNFQFYGCRSHLRLAKGISKQLGIKAFPIRVLDFPDREIKVALEADPRLKNFAILAAANPSSLHRNLWELAQVTSTLKDYAAKRVELILPYLPYSRQERADESGACISTARIAEFLSKVAKIDGLITFDLHVDAIEAIYRLLSIPMVHLSARLLFANYLLHSKLKLEKLVLVAPDMGREKYTRDLIADIYGKVKAHHLGVINKRRISPTKVKILSFHGNVKGKIVVLPDDLISTGGTNLTDAQYLVEEKGAEGAIVMATHPLLVRQASKKLSRSSYIKEVVVTDTVALPTEKIFSKLRVISLRPVLAHIMPMLFEEADFKWIQTQAEEFMREKALEIES